MLTIEDFGGKVTVATPDDLDRALARRYEHAANAFWLYPGENAFPVMGMFVKGDVASVTYMPNEDEAGYVSEGGLDGFPAGEQSMFYIWPNEPQWVLNSSLIPMSVATEGAKELLASGALPKAIVWSKL